MQFHTSRNNTSIPASFQEGNAKSLKHSLRSIAKKSKKVARDNEEIFNLFHNVKSRGTRRVLTMGNSVLSKRSAFRFLKERESEMEQEKRGFDMFLKSDQGQLLVSRLKAAYPGDARVVTGLTLFLSTATKDDLEDPHFADELWVKMQVFMASDDTDKTEYGSDSEEEEEEDEEDDIEDDEELDEDEDHETEVAIFDSPQWRALMVLTATNAEVNNPDFVQKWMTRRSQALADEVDARNVPLIKRSEVASDADLIAALLKFLNGPDYYALIYTLKRKCPDKELDDIEVTLHSVVQSSNVEELIDPFYPNIVLHKFEQMPSFHSCGENDKDIEQYLLVMREYLRTSGWIQFKQNILNKYGYLGYGNYMEIVDYIGGIIAASDVTAFDDPNFTQLLMDEAEKFQDKMKFTPNPNDQFINIFK